MSKLKHNLPLDSSSTLLPGEDAIIERQSSAVTSRSVTVKEMLCINFQANSLKAASANRFTLIVMTERSSR